jgi:hypothetical protein
LSIVTKLLLFKFKFFFHNNINKYNIHKHPEMSCQKAKVKFQKITLVTHFHSCLFFRHILFLKFHFHFDVVEVIFKRSDLLFQLPTCCVTKLRPITLLSDVWCRYLIFWLWFFCVINKNFRYVKKWLYFWRDDETLPLLSFNIENKQRHSFKLHAILHRKWEDISQVKVISRNKNDCHSW